MLHHTKAIVLKQSLYSESSLIVQMFTEKFGLISFMVKGVRKNNKSNKAHFYQIGNMLNLVMYYHPNKNFQLIKECQYDCIYMDMHTSMKKNTILLFSIEVIYQTLIKDAVLEDVFTFYKNFLFRLEKNENKNISLLPITFLLDLLEVYGYKIDNNYSDENCYLHIQEGKFYNFISMQPPFVEKEIGKLIVLLSDQRFIDDSILSNISKDNRESILQVLLQFMELHFSNFKTLKSLPILKTILS